MKKTILTSLVVSTIFFGCSKETNPKDVIITTEINMESRPLNFESTRVENNAHSGKYYSSTDSVRQFGVGYSYVLPDSLRNRKMTVYINGWLRESELPLDGALALSLNNSTGNVAWTTFGDKLRATYKPGEWVQVIDSITYPINFTTSDFVEIGVVGMKTKGKDVLDIDDISVTYKFTK